MLKEPELEWIQIKRAIAEPVVYNIVPETIEEKTRFVIKRTEQS